MSSGTMTAQVPQARSMKAPRLQKLQTRKFRQFGGSLQACCPNHLFLKPIQTPKTYADNTPSHGAWPCPYVARDCVSAPRRNGRHKNSPKANYRSESAAITHATPAATAATATAALPASLQARINAFSRVSTKSAKRSIAVFINSMARINMPRVTINPFNAKGTGRKNTKTSDKTFAKTQLLKLDSFLHASTQPLHDQTERFVRFRTPRF